MQIRVMSREECHQFLGRTRLARLACAHENQPYVLPMHVAYDEAPRNLYAFTFAGQKIDWMRANPRVCIEADEIVADDRWMSVIGVGRYEELPATASSGAPHPRPPERTADGRDGPWDDDDALPDERDRAWELLKNIHPVWFDPECTAWAARRHRDAIVPIYFKIRLDHVTGHQATPDTEGASAHKAPATVAGRWARLRGKLTRVFDGDPTARRRIRTVNPHGLR